MNDTKSQTYQFCHIVFHELEEQGLKQDELTQNAELWKLMIVLNQRGMKYNKNCSVYFVEDLTFFYVLEWVGDDQFDFGNLHSLNVVVLRSHVEWIFIFFLGAYI